MKMREKIAKLAHEQWSGWMDYLFSKCPEYVAGRIQAQEGALIIPKWAVKRWTRQKNTPYKDLSDSEKDSDRAEADKFLAILKAELDQLKGYVHHKPDCATQKIPIDIMQGDNECTCGLEQALKENS